MGIVLETTADNITVTPANLKGRTVREVLHNGSVFWEYSDVLAILDPPSFMMKPVAMAALAGSVIKVLGVGDFIDEAGISGMHREGRTKGGVFLQTRMHERRMHYKVKPSKPDTALLNRIKAEIAAIDSERATLSAKRASLMNDLAQAKVVK